MSTGYSTRTCYSLLYWGLLDPSSKTARVPGIVKPLNFYHHSSLVSRWMRDASSRADVMDSHPLPNARTKVQETWKQTKTQNSQKAAPACSQPSREDKTLYPSQWFTCLYCSGECLLQLVAEKTHVLMASSCQHSRGTWMMLSVIPFSFRESAGSRELDSIVLMGPFQFELFCDSVVSDVFLSQSSYRWDAAAEIGYFRTPGWY